MKHLKYIWRSVTRNKLRSLLTIFSVCVCLALMTVLYGYVAMQEAWSAEVRTRVADIDSGRVKTIPRAEAWKMIDGEADIPD